MNPKLSPARVKSYLAQQEINRMEFWLLKKKQGRISASVTFTEQQKTDYINDRWLAFVNAEYLKYEADAIRSRSNKERMESAKWKGLPLEARKARYLKLNKKFYANFTHPEHTYSTEEAREKIIAQKNKKRFGKNVHVLLSSVIEVFVRHLILESIVATSKENKSLVHLKYCIDRMEDLSEPDDYSLDMCRIIRSFACYRSAQSYVFMKKTDDLGQFHDSHVFNYYVSHIFKDVKKSMISNTTDFDKQVRTCAQKAKLKRNLKFFISNVIAEMCLRIGRIIGGIFVSRSIKTINWVVLLTSVTQMFTAAGVDPTVLLERSIVECPLTEEEAATVNLVLGRFDSVSKFLSPTVESAIGPLEFQEVPLKKKTTKRKKTVKKVKKSKK